MKNTSLTSTVLPFSDNFFSKVICDDRRRKFRGPYIDPTTYEMIIDDYGIFIQDDFEVYLHV